MLSSVCLLSNSKNILLKSSLYCTLFPHSYILLFVWLEYSQIHIRIFLRSFSISSDFPYLLEVLDASAQTLARLWVEPHSHPRELRPQLNPLNDKFKMPTPQWTGFIHSWHTLAIVLKWMCITVVGIPFAIATCVVVAAAVLAFAALVLGAAAGACALVFFFFKGIYCTIFRALVWIANAKRRRAERQLLLPLARAPAVPVQMQMHMWARGIAGTQKPVQVVPAGYMPAPGELQAPPQAHVAPLSESSDSPAGPATALPGTIECQVCLEKKWRADFPARNPTDDCEHDTTDCCNMCLSQAITTAFESNVWDDIRCPTCNLQLLHKDVKEFATPEIFERYVSPIILLGPLFSSF